MRCTHIKEDGSQCRAYAISGEELCYFHGNPEAASEAGKKSMRAKRLDLPKLDIEDFEDFEDYVIAQFKGIQEGLEGLPFTADVGRAITNVVDKINKVMAERARVRNLEAIPYRIIWDDGKSELDEEED